jgi:hypothetical protein
MKLHGSEKLMGYRKNYIPCGSRKGYTPPKMKGTENDKKESTI